MRLNCSHSLISFISAGSWHTTYTRVPHYITSYQRSLALESLEYAVFDLTLEDSVTIEINSSVMTGRIITGKNALVHLAESLQLGRATPKGLYPTTILGNSPLELITSYTAFAGRLSPLPDWVGSGAVLGLQGGTAAVLQVIDQVETMWGNVSDVAAVWLQDWTGQRNFTGTTDLPRVGLWWNWEVNLSFTSITLYLCRTTLNATILIFSHVQLGLLSFVDKVSLLCYLRWTVPIIPTGHP